jgi:hypothetical protein
MELETLEEIIDEIELNDGDFHENTTAICLAIGEMFRDSISSSNFRNDVYAIGRFIIPESFCFDQKGGHCKFETLEADKDLV